MNPTHNSLASETKRHSGQERRVRQPAPTTRHEAWLLCAALAAVLGGTACKREQKELAPEASALPSAAPVTAAAQTYVVDRQSSQVSFQMDAELEKINGRAPGSIEGELFIDPNDLTKTTGLIKVDLLALSIYHTKRESADTQFGEEKKDETQNEHMQTWFQISKDAPLEVREANRFAEFKIKTVQAVSELNLTKLTGAERQVTAEVLGDFRLHGRVTEQKLAVAATFQFSGDTPTGLTLKTTAPFGVSLEAHDVRPRKAFDKLADATLETLGQKVSKVALVSFELSAKPR